MCIRDSEILHDYLIESKELLQRAQEDALRLETEPGNDAAVASIFRAFHTIKGGAGFLEAGHLVDWAQMCIRDRSTSMHILKK